MLIRVSPSEWVVRVGTKGRLTASQGASFWLWPWETYLRFPSTIQWMLFSASQITRENQGVDVKGAFSWRVVDPVRAYQNLNMTRMGAPEVRELMGARSSTAEACVVDHGPLMRTTLLIRQLAESVTRNAIANMSLEEALRDRRAIVETLTHQIDTVIVPWGLAMTSIEIVDVFDILSGTFAHMQAEYRESMRRQARAVQIETDEDLTQREISSRSRLASLEHEQAMGQLALRSQREQRELELQQAVMRQRQTAEAALAMERTTAQAQRQQAETETRLECERMEQELGRERRRGNLELLRSRIETRGQGNEAYRSQQLLAALPDLARTMKADKTTVISNTLGSTSLEGLLASMVGVAEAAGSALARPPLSEVTVQL